MDDIIFEEFKGTGNMELHLDRKLSDRRIFPAIDMFKSGTRREELLLDERELEGALKIRRLLSGGNPQETAEQLIGMMEKTSSNADFFNRLKAGWPYLKRGLHDEVLKKQGRAPRTHGMQPKLKIARSP